MPNLPEIPIPPQSAQTFRTHKGITNPGLIFDRFAPRWRKGGENEKKQGLEWVVGARSDPNLLREWNARWQACVQAAHATPFSLKTDWRFIAGLGRKGPLEVGFTFHRYGFPILPGSSVKGLARAWALIAIAQQVNQASLKELDDILSSDGDRDSKERQRYEAWRAQQSADVQKMAEDFRAIFGTTAVAGRAVFFDAIPASKPRLELDIMNPHYPKYYSGEEFPTDWQSPVPVYFLTVAPNTEFRFAVGWRGPLNDDGRRLRDRAKDWLIVGLTELGAGAKTSAGYGYFAAPRQPAQPADVTPQPAATVQAVQSAPTPSTPSPPAIPAPAEEILWRTGTVREYQPERGRGRLVDDESGEELRFDRAAIATKGWSPGKKHKVRYAVAQREGRTVVVKVQKA